MPAIDYQPAQPRSRLDHLLQEKFPDQSRAQIQKIIKSGQVKVNGKVENKPGFAVQVKAMITVIDNPFATTPASTLKPELIPLDIVFEDKYLLVVNKPAGLVVHPTSHRREGTLVNALLGYCKLGKGADLNRPGIVHRLDKDTSGLIIIAKTVTALRNLSNQIKARAVEKKYVAVVHGQVVAAYGTIDRPIGRHQRDRKKMAVTQHGRTRKAVTHFRVIQSFNTVTLLDLTLETGRTHQIRVHLSSLGHPILGDAYYGKDKSNAGQLLHAYYLKFAHPISGEPIELQVQAPERFGKWKEFIDQAMSVNEVSTEDILITDTPPDRTKSA